MVNIVGKLNKKLKEEIIMPGKDGKGPDGRGPKRVNQGVPKRDGRGTGQGRRGGRGTGRGRGRGQR